MSNMAQGYATSDFAVAFFDTLVRPSAPGLQQGQQHLILWEFGINDSELDSSWRRQILELFIRRVMTEQPEAALGFLVLWPSMSQRCFPDCLGRFEVWKDLMAVLSYYSSKLRAFAINVDMLAERMFYNRSNVLFLDRHHPTQIGHIAIAGSLSTAFTRSHSSTLESAACARDQVRAAPGSQHFDLDLSWNFFPGLSDGSQRFLRLLTSGAHSSLHLHPSLPPRLHLIPSGLFREHRLSLRSMKQRAELIASGAFGDGSLPVLLDLDLSQPNRVDSKTVIWLPQCHLGTLTYRVSMQLQYLGMNVHRYFAGRLLRVRTNNTSPVSAWWIADGGERLMGSYDQLVPPAVLMKGLSPLVPQLWFSMHSGTTSASANLSICASVGERGLLTTGIVAF